ncbi:hypothetical protein Y1Q_0020499 [Alligator mississippiensis]|uniref:Uncharacterized protein n=1 Tax=Alligator mississippiensis TaxID=8496 RepID=A0A151NJU6_ALLMI|nr:hypothetical protein Y1Q_0020499 [Alligator mississippiensis]
MRVLRALLRAGAAAYRQGQRPGPRAREYFYYVDHQGQLFLDDAKVKNFITCFKVSMAPAARCRLEQVTPA